MKNKFPFGIILTFVLFCHLSTFAQQKHLSISLGTNKAYYQDLKTWGQLGASANGTYTLNRMQYGLNFNLFTIDKQTSPNKVGDIVNFYQLTTLQTSATIGYAIIHKPKFSITPNVGIVVERRNVNIPLSYVVEPNSDKITRFNAQTTHKNTVGAAVGINAVYKILPKISINLSGTYYLHQAAKDVHPTLKTNYFLTNLGVGYHF